MHDGPADSASFFATLTIVSPVTTASIRVGEGSKLVRYCNMAHNFFRLEIISEQCVTILVRLLLITGLTYNPFRTNKQMRNLWHVAHLLII